MSRSAGEVDCLIDSDRIRLREGDGIFIGSRVIHGFESAAPAIMPNVLFPPSFLFQEGTDIYTESMLPVLDSGITSAVMRRDDAAAGGVLDALRGVYRLVRSGGGKLDLFLSCGILWREFLTFLGTAGDGKLTRRVSGHDMLTSSRMQHNARIYLGELQREDRPVDDSGVSGNIKERGAEMLQRVDRRDTGEIP